MKNTHPLTEAREACGLSQTELGLLLDRAQATVSRYEGGEDYPDLETMTALQIVFGASVRKLFPALCAKVADEVMARGADLDFKIRHRTDRKAGKMRRLLSEMAKRAGKALRT